MLFVIIYLSGCGSQIGEQAAAKTDNYEIFNRLAGKVVQCTIDSSEITCNNTNVYMRNGDPTGANGWFIENWYIKSLQQMQCDSIATLTELEPAINKNSILIDYKIIKLNVDYQSQDTFWKSKPVRRTIELKLWAKFSRLNNNGKVLWMGECAESYSDHVRRARIPDLQNKHIAFTQAPVPEFNGYSKVLEPTFVMGISGVIIYLFYSFRSK